MAGRPRHPDDCWISNLPVTTTVADLVRCAKMRGRIEHDYRELKRGLGLYHAAWLDRCRPGRGGDLGGGCSRSRDVVAAAA
ncbi:hypothetical protein LUX09_00325 [Streptomyces albogriseolus]|nr:hypothetical protein [Streptomyces albogriseolus]